MKYLDGVKIPVVRLLETQPTISNSFIKMQILTLKTQNNRKTIVIEFFYRKIY